MSARCERRGPSQVRRDRPLGDRPRGSAARIAAPGRPGGLENVTHFRYASPGCDWWADGLAVGRCAGGGQSVCRIVLGGDLRRLHLAVTTHTHTTCVLFFPLPPT